ncbi:hypothetical protein [Hymenobacter terricola]|uniref:hypothetical protein n=1 Tax=Hymenobacter terricola TaxID=2819236 RepID=UPI001B30E9DD|nr:hypothetical protein [Hymenobacter terricola]
MNASFFSAFAAASLFATTAFAAAPAPADHDRDDRYEQQNPHDRYSDRNSKDFNYGFDKKHRVSDQERQRWEAAHRIAERKDERKDERKEMRHDERKDKDFNYGYAKNHRVSDQERQRWEAAHHYDGRR